MTDISEVNYLFAYLSAEYIRYVRESKFGHGYP